MEELRPFDSGEPDEPPASGESEHIPPIVIFKDRRPKKEIDLAVLSEGGYSVEFSDRGDKWHNNPSPPNLGLRPPFICILRDYPPIACKNPWTRADGLCREHSPSKEEKRPLVFRRHWADWIGRIITPGLKREQCVAWAPAHQKLIEIMLQWAGTDSQRCVTIDDFMFDIMRELKGKVPDSTVLQKDLEERRGKLAQELADRALKAVERRFPKKEFEGTVTNGGTYKHKEDSKVSLEKIPVRVVAALFYLGVVSEEANRSDLWGFTEMGRPKQSKRASVYMPLDYYFLRVYFGANRSQARQTVRQ